MYYHILFTFLIVYHIFMSITRKISLDTGFYYSAESWDLTMEGINCILFS